MAYMVDQVQAIISYERARQYNLEKKKPFDFFFDQNGLWSLEISYYMNSQVYRRRLNCVRIERRTSNVNESICLSVGFQF